VGLHGVCVWVTPRELFRPRSEMEEAEGNQQGFGKVKASSVLAEGEMKLFWSSTCVKEYEIKLG